jgi:hypothetical protein
MAASNASGITSTPMTDMRPRLGTGLDRLASRCIFLRMSLNFIRRCAAIGFAFFLIKGLIWLAILGVGLLLAL